MHNNEGPDVRLYPLALPSGMFLLFHCLGPVNLNVSGFLDTLVYECLKQLTQLRVVLVWALMILLNSSNKKINLCIDEATEEPKNKIPKFYIANGQLAFELE